MVYHTTISGYSNPVFIIRPKSSSARAIDLTGFAL